MIESSPSTENCVIDGVDNADWQSTYGGKTSGNELSLDFVTNGPYSRNVGSRTYLLDTDGQNYVMFNLLNRWAYLHDLRTRWGRGSPKGSN